jgi:hypothetical protein
MMFRKALLPILESPLDDQCRSHSPNMHCFKGGDSRTNEQPGNYCAVFITLTADVLFNLCIPSCPLNKLAHTNNGVLKLSLHDMFETGLSSMHTAWMREHNRLVRKLAELNPHWNDERLFHGM